MTAVHTELGLDSAARLADECADNLAVTPDLPPGFANGRAGIAWALATRPEVQDVQHPEGVLQGVGAGWCAGFAGIAAARAAVAKEAEATALIHLLADQPLRDDLSLCHGELGIAEALGVLQRAGWDAGAALRKRAGLVIGAIDRHGTPCGTPGGVATPGLLTGLAGVGYGLLRLGFAERVPSVLLFEPTPRPAGRGYLEK
jgi:lantibiotic modifying enzyme